MKWKANFIVFERLLFGENKQQIYVGKSLKKLVSFHICVFQKHSFTRGCCVSWLFLLFLPNRLTPSTACFFSIWRCLTEKSISKLTCQRLSFVIFYLAGRKKTRNGCRGGVSLQTLVFEVKTGPLGIGETTNLLSTNLRLLSSSASSRSKDTTSFGLRTSLLNWPPDITIFWI